MQWLKLRNVEKGREREKGWAREGREKGREGGRAKWMEGKGRKKETEKEIINIISTRPHLISLWVAPFRNRSFYYILWSDTLCKLTISKIPTNKTDIWYTFIYIDMNAHAFHIIALGLLMTIWQHGPSILLCSHPYKSLCTVDISQHQIKCVERFIK